MKRLAKTFIALVFIFSQTNAQNDIAGYWSGKIKMLTMNLDFQIKVEKTKKTLNAFMSIPSQKLNNYQLAVFTFKKNNVHFELPSQAGIANFDGELNADSIKGKILQAGIQGTFYLAKMEEPKAVQQNEPKIDEPLPYFEDEVAFKSGRILLAGTLTIPKEEKKYPAVILLTGSGPQNRDEEIYGFKIFQKIADYLTRKGIAVLRYDDRGVGGSTGNTMQSTTEDFAEDARAAIDFLIKQKNIDPKKIGFLGHSEGGIIAPLVAANSNNVAFLVLMSGTGVNGGDVLLEQQKMILKASGVADSLIDENLALQKEINKALSNDKDLNDIKKDITAFAEKDFETLSKEIKASIKDKNAYINSTVQSQIILFNNPWFRYFIKYDPAPTLQKVKVPVLMTFGELDLQVPVNQNKPKMEEALRSGGNNNFKSIIFPKANHLYQEAKTGSPGEYNELQKEFVPGFLQTIADWIIQTVK
ncbi:MAG: alpha/beta fold hydrolase [Ignavibacteriales bacterium]|nr:alpha/beta fold hydrolase [Ignavibacteriales bacterium]